LWSSATTGSSPPGTTRGPVEQLLLLQRQGGPGRVDGRLALLHGRVPGRLEVVVGVLQQERLDRAEGRVGSSIQLGSAMSQEPSARQP